MSLLEVKSLEFKYSEIDLYKSVSFNVERGEHVVLVGPNGSGKSTLMKLLNGQLTPDKGSVNWFNNIKFSYLDQFLEVKKDIRIDEYLYGVYEDLFNREKQMNDIYASLGECDPDKMESLLNRAESIREYLEQNDFYNIETLINNVLVGLGLNMVDLSRDLKTLSGGEKAKVFLAKLLLEENDFILMDEPTNFLDKSHVEWLIGFLKDYKGAFLVISHDTEFLRGIANIVLSLENKDIVRYKGNYDYYLKEKDLRHVQQINAYNKQQEFIKKTTIYINKNRARATTAKSAQSRVKVLEKLNILEEPKEQYKVKIKFPYSKEPGLEVLKLNQLEVGYTNALLPPIDYIFERGERVEIIGKNGIGKSTLIKTILGIIKPISGEYKFNLSIDVNYYSQEEDCDMSITPIDYIRLEYPMYDNQQVLSTLAPLGIRGELAHKKLLELSGGEFGRVRLARMSLKKSNILVLDEPTNHLDKLTKLALHDAIEAYPGTVILVSHEIGFLDDLIDSVIKF